MTAVIRLVTFDLDDTLWSVDGVIRRAVQETDAWLIQRVPEYGSLSAGDRSEIARQVAAEHPQVRHDVSKLRLLTLRNELRQLGLAFPRADELAAAAFDEFLRWRHRVRFFPGALEVLEQLGEGYLLASLTNGNADYARLGLDRFFSFGLCAADVGVVKPDTRMFRRALERAGVTPSEAVHVGDHPIDDIQGATDAGMASIWVNLDGKEEVVEATATVSRLEDVPKAVAALQRR